MAERVLSCDNYLYAGVSTTPVEMLVKDDQPEFPILQFPLEGVLLPTTMDDFGDSDLGAPMAYT